MVESLQTPMEGPERRHRVAGKEEEVGNDGAVTGGERKCSKVGVVGTAEMDVPELGA
jgi:hypothetical protein